MKRNNGITLIALVITIIILIILAAIAINAVFGENGLILRAQEAKFKTEVSSIKDLIDVKRLELEASNYFNESAGDLSAYLNGLDYPEYIGESEKKIILRKGQLWYWNEGDSEFSDTEKQWLKDIGIHPYGGDDIELFIVKMPTTPGYAASFRIRLRPISPQGLEALLFTIVQEQSHVLLDPNCVIQEINNFLSSDFENIEEFVSANPLGHGSVQELIDFTYEGFSGGNILTGARS